MRLLSILFILTIILLSGSITTKDKNTKKEKVETPKIAEHVEPQNNNEQVQKEEPQVSKEPEVAKIDSPKEPESSPKNTQKEEVETPKEPEHVEPQNNNEQVQKEEPQVSKEPEVATIDLPKEPESSPKNPVNYASIDLFEVIFKKIDGDAPICSEKVDLKAVFQKIQEYIRCH